MNKVVIFFEKKSADAKRFPIIKAFNIPDHIDIPANITTYKISNISLLESCKVVGGYKLIGEFFEQDNVTYLKAAMVMGVKNVEYVANNFEGTI